MKSEDALEKLKAILGKGIYPAAIPEVEAVLRGVEKYGFEAGYEYATETVGDWYEADYQDNEGYD